MSFDLVRGQLSADVATNGTFTVPYPTNRQAGDYYKSINHRVNLMTVPTGALTTPNAGGNDEYTYPKDFGITLGSVSAGTVTITNKTATTWKAGTFYTVRLERQGSTDYRLGLPGTTSPTFAYATVTGRTVLMNLGAPVAKSATRVAAAQAVAGAGNLTLASTTVTLDRPRNIQAVSAGAGDTTQTITVYGTDIYGVAMTETIALNGTTIVTGNKAFKTVTRVAISAATAGNISVGDQDKLGLSVFLPETAFVIKELQDGVAATAGTLVAGDVTAGGATATTGDVRGTYTPNSAPNDSRVYQLLIFLPDYGYAGVTQA